MVSALGIVLGLIIGLAMLSIVMVAVKRYVETLDAASSDGLAHRELVEFR